MEEKKEVPKVGMKKAAGDGPSFSQQSKNRIIEELKLMAAGRYEYGKVAATINALPVKERKGALISFLEASLGSNTVDAIDFNEIIRGAKLPEADRSELIAKYQKYLHD